MTLLWFLNPWREVRRLEEANFALNRNWCDALAVLEERNQENAELRRQVADLTKTSADEPALCGCQRCAGARPGLPGPCKPGWRYACEKCGNKRCPHHQWHGFKCTGSNEPDQIREWE